MGLVGPVGYIHYQRPGGARMAPNYAVPMWHIRHHRQDGEDQGYLLPTVRLAHL